MGFFDEFGKKFSNTMKSAKDKTNKFSSEMKLKSKISEKQDKITVLYSEIGKEIYSNYLKGITSNTDIINEKLKNISNINEELKKINKEILSIKGIKVCAICGGEIPVDAEYCPKCGNKIIEITDKVPDNITVIEVQDTKEENQSLKENDEEKKDE